MSENAHRRAQELECLVCMCACSAAASSRCTCAATLVSYGCTAGSRSTTVLQSTTLHPQQSMRRLSHASRGNAPCVFTRPRCPSAAAGRRACGRRAVSAAARQRQAALPNTRHIPRPHHAPLVRPLPPLLILCNSWLVTRRRRRCRRACAAKPCRPLLSRFGRPQWLPRGIVAARTAVVFETAVCAGSEQHVHAALLQQGW